MPGVIYDKFPVNFTVSVHRCHFGRAKCLASIKNYLAQVFDNYIRGIIVKYINIYQLKMLDCFLLPNIGIGLKN